MLLHLLHLLHAETPVQHPANKQGTNRARGIAGAILLNFQEKGIPGRTCRRTVMLHLLHFVAREAPCNTMQHQGANRP